MLLEDGPALPSGAEPAEAQIAVLLVRHRPCQAERSPEVNRARGDLPEAKGHAGSMGLGDLGAEDDAEAPARLRTERQASPAFAYDSKPLLALTMWVAAPSKGQPIAIDGARLKVEIEAGRRLFEMRQGQLNLSCAHCHEDNWGRKLAGSTIPQGHPTGYPQYRLEWQGVGSLHRRLRNCLTGMRAETLDPGSAELTALEAYLMARAEGMAIESPAVRP